MGLIVLFAAGLALFGLSLVAYTVRLLTRPPRRTYAWAVARGLPGDPGEASPSRAFESFTFTSRGITLAAWEIAGDRPGGPTFIFTHGWGESKLSVLPRLAALAPECSRVIAWDLPGHGESGGACALGGPEAQDLCVLADRARDRTPLVLAGFSLGAGVSIAAAADAGAAAVIAEAPYRVPATPARNVLRARSLPWRFNLPAALAWVGLHAGWGPAWRSRPFDRAAMAARLGVPLLVVVGEADRVCPPEEAQAIAGSRGELVRVPGAGHLDLWTGQASAERAGRAIAAFLARLHSGRAGPIVDAPAGR